MAREPRAGRQPFLSSAAHQALLPTCRLRGLHGAGPAKVLPEPDALQHGARGRRVLGLLREATTAAGCLRRAELLHRRIALAAFTNAAASAGVPIVMRK